MHEPELIVSLTGVSVLGILMAGALCGALGPYLVWRRMGLLGDAIAHAGLAVVAVSLLLDISSTPLLLVFAALIGYLLSFAQEKNFSELDSVLAILFAGFMGLGLLIIHFSGKSSEEILHVLFGDVSQTNSFDLIVLAALSAFVVSYLLWFRKPLQLMLLHSDLARIEGVQVNKHNRTLLIVCALTVAICLKIMGVVLVTSLFIAPALISRAFARSSRQHTGGAIAAGVILVGIGTVAANALRLPVSATIAVLGLMLFLIASMMRKNA